MDKDAWPFAYFLAEITDQIQQVGTNDLWINRYVKDSKKLFKSLHRLLNILKDRKAISFFMDGFLQTLILNDDDQTISYVLGKG